MKKTIIALCVVFTLMISVGLVVASAKNQNQKFNLPKHAVEVSPGVFYLGKTIDKGKVVEGYAFMIRDKEKFAKPGTVCGNGICEPGENINKCPLDCGGGEDPTEPDTSSCYGFLSKGAKWKSVENYIVNTNNEDGLSEGFITGNLADSIVKWETAANYDILGTGSSTNETLVADFYTTDNKNEVYFDDLGASDTIAFTVVWGIFGGRPSNRELVEWDMVFNDNFIWGDATINSSVMDFENIATHELGHAVGMDDLYNSACSDQTMYGYSWNGDISKRDLASGDIAGIRALY
ncbi:MAG: matrixin family metalloprotease [Candidatus Diapherotrites archaeon]